MGPVGNGIVRFALVPELARDWARTAPLLLVKLATDRPKPKLVNPPPVMVKLAGGVARLMGLGVMELTAVPIPLSIAKAPAPPLKLTFPSKMPADVGLKRTVTV